LSSYVLCPSLLPTNKTPNPEDPLGKKPFQEGEEVSSSNFIVLNGTLAFTTIELIISEVR
jgi:hypothetical protein